MACGALNGGSIDLQRQREALQQLRREVEALDDVAEGSSASPASPVRRGAESPQAASRGMSRGAQRPKHPQADVQTKPEPLPRTHGQVPMAVIHADNRLEDSIAELEAQSCALSAECEAAKVDLVHREADRSAAKAAWSRALAHGAAAEGREERRLAAARHEHDELRNDEMQEEAAYRLESEKLRQRQRNLRMQLKQADRAFSEAAEEEAFHADFPDSTNSGDAEQYHAKAARASSQRGSARAGSSSAGRARGQGRGGPGRTSTGAKEHATGALARFAEAQQRSQNAKEQVVELRRRHAALLEGQRDLQERERALRRAAKLSDHEVEHLRRREVLRSEEGQLRADQTELREELHSVDSQVSATKREAARLRSAQEGMLRELGERDLDFQRHEASEMQELCTIDEYLMSVGAAVAAGEHGRNQLAEWIEADICCRQVVHVRRRLGEIVADAGARAQVLERAVAELHADLDRRAAIILELVERQGAEPEASGNHASGGAPMDLLPADCSPGAGTVSHGSVSEEEAGNQQRPRILSPNRTSPSDCALTTPSPGAGDGLETSAYGSCAGKESPGCRGLERQALEAELEHQRGLFELRSDQVQGLEERLAALLAREAPRVHALRAWVAVHAPLAQERLAACMAAAAGQKVLRADVEAMRHDKSSRLAEMEAGWRAERRQLVDASGDARRGAEGAAAHVADLLRRREQLLKDLDQNLKMEHRLSTRVTAANEAVDRDQRRLVEVTARQLRSQAAASGKSRPAKGEGVRQALKEAQDLVEAARLQQAEALVGLAREGSEIALEIRRVGEVLEQEVASEEKAQLELSEAEAKHIKAQYGHEGSTAASCSSPRSAGLATPRQPPPSSKLNALERRRARLDADLSAVTEQLRQADCIHEEVEAGNRGLWQHAQRKVEEVQEELEVERKKQRASSASVLKQYRKAQASCVDAEQRHSELRMRGEALERDLSEGRGALKRVRERRLKRAHLERQRAARGFPSQNFEPEDGLCGVRGGGATSSNAAPVAGPQSFVQPRPVPSIVEMRLRIDTDTNPGLYGFYLQVFPLLCGTHVEIYRRAKQRFETRQLVLSCDLQRLELWPPAPSTASSPMMFTTNDDADGRNDAPAASPDTPRARGRLAESFIRVESLVRVHVPKSTLAAVQRVIMSNTSGGLGEADTGETAHQIEVPHDMMGADVEDACDSPLASARFSPEVEEAVQSWPLAAGMQRAGTGSAPRISGISAPQTPRSASGGGTGASHASTMGAHPPFPFDLVMNCSEPWRLMAADVHTFHVVTAAVNALLMSRDSLSAYSVTLGLRGQAAHS